MHALALLDAAEGSSSVDWQHLGAAGFVGICFAFAPFVTKILVAWWNRKRGDEEEEDVVGLKRVAQAVERVAAKVDDVAVRFKEHVEQERQDIKEIRDEFSDALHRIEVELARGTPR